MSEDNKDNYRPRSPDLSEFLPPPERRRQPSLPHLPSFHASDSSFPPGYAFSPRGSYDASPYFQPPTTQAGSYFGATNQVQTPVAYTSPKSTRTPSVPNIQNPWKALPGQASQQDTNRLSQPRLSSVPNIYTQTPPGHDRYDVPGLDHDERRLERPNPNFPPYYHNAISTAEMARTRGKRPAGSYYEGDDDTNNNQIDGTYDPATNQQQAPLLPPPPINPSVPFELSLQVATKFPVARIKRIMQADEDVGKVAQATPTAVAKALELFMVTLITKGAVEARQSNSKRITAQHLKSALMADQQFDFLGDVCENVVDETQGGSGAGGGKKGRAKSEAESGGSEMEEEGGKARKKSKPGA